MFLTSAQTIAIKAGRFIDPDAGKVLNDQIIVIQDGKFQAVGHDIAIPAGAKVIDLSKMTVLPGLIDCHTHVADGGDAEPINVLQKSASESVLAAIPNARKMLEAGFTTVRDVGVYRALNDIALRDAIAKGYVVGPRMYVAGAYITITGGAGAMTGMAPDIQLPWDLHYGEANSPWEVRQKIRLLAHDGVDVIKLLSTGAVLDPWQQSKIDRIYSGRTSAAVDEARHFGLKVAAHAHAAEGIKNAIRAGVASIEHANLIDDEGIALAKQHGTYLDMDIYDEECIQENGRKRHGAEGFSGARRRTRTDSARKFPQSGQSGRENVVRHRCRRVSLWYRAKQFAFMVKYGMTPMQAIQAATTNAADLLGHSDVVGSIKPGKYADMIAVSADPLHDISVLEHVQFVMKEGTVYKQ